MKNNQIILIAGAGIVAWYFLAGPGKAHAASIAPGEPSPALLPGESITPSVYPSTPTGPVSIPVPGANMMDQSGANQYATVAQQTILFNWANTLPAKDQARFYATYGSFSRADILGLLGLIQTWTAGQTPTADQVNFWNTWRVTYQIRVS